MEVNKDREKISRGRVFLKSFPPHSKRVPLSFNRVKRKVCLDMIKLEVRMGLDRGIEPRRTSDVRGKGNS